MTQQQNNWHQNLRIKIVTDEFIVFLFLMKEVMSKTKVMTKTFQKKELDIIDTTVSPFMHRNITTQGILSLFVSVKFLSFS